jgi:hypothetical protein
MTAAAMRQAADATQRYGLEPAIERALAYRLCRSPWLWGILGPHLKASAMSDAGARALVGGCAAVAVQQGAGPRRPESVIQAMRTARDAGQLSQAAAIAAMDLLDEGDQIADAAAMPPDSELVAVVAPVLRQFERQELVREADKLVADRESLAKLAARIDTVERIGTVTAVQRVRADDSVWRDIAELRRAERMGFGIPQLDTALRGGVPRRTLTSFGADTGIGKTAALVHTAAYRALRGQRVWVAALEMTPVELLIRLIACLTGCTIDEVETGNEVAVQRWQLVRQLPEFGAIAVVPVAPAPTVGQLREAVADELKLYPAFEFGWDDGIIDYADKMSGAESDQNSNAIGKTIYTGLRDWAQESDGRITTASQLKDLDGRKIPQATDLCDSRWKPRLATLVVTIWTPDTEEGEQPDGSRSYHVAKNTHGPAGAILERVPTDLARARYAVLDFPLDNGIEGLLARARRADHDIAEF